jgi:hypothetical protein
MVISNNLKDMVIKKTVSPSEFYNQYLIILNGILNLTDVERRITVLLLEDYNNIRGLDFKSKTQLVFSPDNRKKIAKTLGVTQKSFNNYVVKLRKKGIINDEGISLVLYTDVSNTQIQFSLEIGNE